jgi:predicted ferric reductase
MSLFHIRKQGYWTTALYNLAAKKKEITVLLEGPYGSLGVDLTSNRYKMAMFLSGGIGVMPMQSICHQMLYEHEWDERDLKNYGLFGLP